MEATSGSHTLSCFGLAFVGVFHVSFATYFGDGLRQIGALLVATAVFGLRLVNA
jgi:hypothetical protein